jgi:hypothetical protein
LVFRRLRQRSFFYSFRASGGIASEARVLFSANGGCPMETSY